jgi:hypothetical protein
VTLHERRIADATVLDVEGRVSTEEDAAALHDALDGLIRQGRLKLTINLELVPTLDTWDYVRSFGPIPLSPDEVAH